MISEHFERGKHQVLFDVVREGNDLRGVGETTGRRKKTITIIHVCLFFKNVVPFSFFLLFSLLSRSIV